LKLALNDFKHNIIGFFSFALELRRHIGNAFDKDYTGARAAGFHALLLDRFRLGEREEWEAKGAPVFHDLIDVVEYLSREGFQFPRTD